LAAWIVAGELDASVHATFDLDSVTSALAKLESGAVQGKVAVRLRD